MPSALTPIAWQSLSSATSTVTFSSIPGTYRDLRVVITASSTSATSGIKFNINGDTASNYSDVVMAGTGSTTTSSMQTAGYGFFSNQAYMTSGGIFLATLDFLDYSATDKHKTTLTRSNNAATGVDAWADRWASTAAITSIVFAPTSATTFAAGSTFALYGVSA